MSPRRAKVIPMLVLLPNFSIFVIIPPEIEAIRVKITIFFEIFLNIVKILLV